MLSRFWCTVILSLFSLLASFTAQAQSSDAVSSTIVTPSTGTTTTTTVNPVTQETTVTKSNPVTGETTTTVIKSPTPAPQEAVTVPEGFWNCFTVEAGWYKNIWVDEHRVCQYQGAGFAGEAWIAGHWLCTKYKASEGICTKWEWSASHWEKTLTIY
jgi:hypothetical protein